MANGIALSPCEDYILIAETSVCRIIRYWVSGTNAGKKEVFVDNLPGYPDNIRLSATGLYRVGISTTRFPSFFAPFLDALGPYPFLKRLIAKVTLTLCGINCWCCKNVDFFFPPPSVK
uniref:Adipocyte plasma membrane associated protein n=1 Tax=Hypotaenidia okinawae TaxID=2861861 RepID=A0A6G1REA3_9GRUI